MNVAIVIMNHNLAAFVGDAIRSALEQSRPARVVVVDDASTDHSLEVINGFGDEIELVKLDENRGHMGAFVAGVTSSDADVVLGLDADDRAAPDRVALMLDAFDDPDVVQVAGSLRLIDADGHPLAVRSGRARFLPRIQPVPTSGDVRPQLLRYGHYEPSVTSGLAWRGSALRSALEHRPSDRRLPPDTYLTAAMPFLGSVAGLADVVFDYRLHGDNDLGGGADFEKFLYFREQRISIVNDWARRTGVTDRLRADDDARWVLDRYLAGNDVPPRARARALFRTPAELARNRPGLAPSINTFVERTLMAVDRDLGAEIVASGLPRAIRAKVARR